MVEDKNKIIIKLISSTSVWLILQTVLFIFKYVLERDMPWWVLWFPSLIYIGLPVALCVLALGVVLIACVGILIYFGSLMLYNWVEDNYSEEAAKIVVGVLLAILAFILGAIIF